MALLGEVVMSRNVVFSWLMGVVVVAVFGSAIDAAPARPEELPNVVIIFTDDQGYQDVGCFGSLDIGMCR